MPSPRVVACIMIASIAVAACAADAAPRPQFVNTRDVVVSFDARGLVRRVELWVSRDAGRSWQRVQAPRWDRSSLLYSAPGDGRYELYLRLIGPQPMPEPTSGAVPHQSLVVDTVPPIVQIRSATVTTDPPGVALDLIVIEEHLRSRAIRLLYRTAADKPWRDTGLRPAGSGPLHLPLPADATSRLDLRLIVTDAAGNRGMDQRLGLNVSTARIPPPASQPAADQGVTKPSRRPQPARTDPQTQARIDRLRKRAERQLALARYAEARRLLQQALALKPDDAGLLTALGMAWLRSGERDKAEELLKQALAQQPQPRALEGLALIAALRHDWPTARSRLEALLKLEPDSALLWLRLGDIEHRMGRRDAARDAWQRAESLAREDELRQRAGQRLRLLVSDR